MRGEAGARQIQGWVFTPPTHALLNGQFRLGLGTGLVRPSNPAGMVAMGSHGTGPVE